MTKKEIEILAKAFYLWSRGPWQTKDPIAYAEAMERWMPNLVEVLCIAEQIEAMWRGFA